MCTDRQTAFLSKLAAERPAWASAKSITDNFLKTLSVKDASKLIDDALKVRPEKSHNGHEQKPGTLPLQELKEGSYWTLDNQVARVRASKSSGRLYAEQLNADTGKFSYIRGTIYNLRARMTLDEAKAWGARFSRCCVCGKFLTDPNSIEAGIGPICIKKI